MRYALCARMAILTLSFHGVEAQTRPTTTPAPCAASVHREFDFWLGDWDVITADGKFAGTNRITAVNGGCGLRETWVSAAGNVTGQSLNAVGADGQWHQTWIDSSGLRLELAGGLVNGAMVMEGDSPSVKPDQPPTRNRITWTRQGADVVRQHWETSMNLGNTWTTAFDGVYHRVPAPGPLKDSFLTRLQGGWIGAGQLMKRDSHVELRVEAILGQPLFRLNWRNVMTTTPRMLFEGSAIYEDDGKGGFAATWWDSSGAKRAITATVSDSSMTSLWGANGRTTYAILSSGDLEVIDSVKNANGTWGEFAKCLLKKN